MSRSSLSAFLLGAALVLAGAGVAAGAGAALLAAALAAAWSAIALSLRHGPAPAQPAWLVGSGALVAMLGVLLVLAGARASGIASLALGTSVLIAGTRLALETEPLPPGLELPSEGSARLHAAVAADEGLRFFGRALGWLAPPDSPLAFAAALRDVADRHRELGWTETPWRAHPTPPSLEKAEVRRVTLRGVGEVEQLSFDSEYVPSDPEIRDAYLGVGPNHTARAFLWRHADGPRPTLLCLHGYGMGRPAWDARVFGAERLHREIGLDLALVVLPLHGLRARGWRSGQGFLGPHPLWTNAAMGQTVWDLRRLSGWLRAQGAPALGVYGLSLGAYAAALFASLERRLACAIPALPFVSLADLVLRDLSEEQRLAREAVGWTRAALEDAWAPHDPLRHVARLAPEARLIVAGLADRICPPAQAYALWEHWDRPAIHWFPGSHLVPLGRGPLRARLDRHLRDTLVAASSQGELPLTRFRT